MEVEESEAVVVSPLKRAQMTGQAIAPFFVLPNPRIPSPHIHVHLRRSGHHHCHLSLPRLLRTLQIPQCPQLQGVGREKRWWNWLREKVSWEGGTRGVGWHTGSKGAERVMGYDGLKTKAFPPAPLRLNTQRQMPSAPEVMDGPPLLPLSPNLR